MRPAREHDLIDGDTVLALLNPDRVGAGGREIDMRSGHVVPVVVPAPAVLAAAAAVLEADRRGARRADAPEGLARRVDAVGELDVHRIVRPRIVVGLDAQPQMVGPAGVRLERQLEKRGRRRGGRRDLGEGSVRIPETRPPGGCRIGHDLPVATNNRRVPRVEDSFAVDVVPGRDADPADTGALPVGGGIAV
jgi:hypothetical protein